MSANVELNHSIVIAELFYTGHNVSGIIETLPMFLKFVIKLYYIKLQSGQRHPMKVHIPRSQRIHEKRPHVSLNRRSIATTSQPMATRGQKSRRNVTAKSKAIPKRKKPLATMLLSHLKHNGGSVRVLVDEKNFVVDEV